MSIKYREISFIEFVALDCITLFHDEKTGRRFGVLTNGLTNYKFSWQSDLIAPVVTISDNNISCCLGVDQMFSMVEFNEDAFRIVLKLDYLLYDIRYIGLEIWVITELEILVINATNYNIDRRVSLPSFFKTMILKPSVVTVECLDGEIVNIEIS